MCALLVVALAVSGCSAFAGDEETRESTSVDVSADEETELASSDGTLTVVIPEGAVAADGKLSLAPVTGPNGQSGYAIDLADTELVGEATLRFEMPDGLEEGEPAPRVSYNDDAGDPITPVSSTVEDGQLVVRTDHFSNWFTDRWSDLRDRVVPDMEDGFDRLLSAAGEGKQPSCAEQESARADGFEVTSDQGRRVYWCFGRENGDFVLKTVNARGYAVAAEATPGLGDAVVDSTWADIADLMSAPPFDIDNHVDAVPSGAGATYIVDDLASGTAAGVTFRADAGAYLVSALGYAAETVDYMLSTTTGTGASQSYVLQALQGASCLQALVDMSSTELTSAAETQAFFADALTLSFDCVEAAIADYDFGAILEFLVQPVLWVWSGVTTAMNGFVAAADTTSEMFGDVGYTIYINRLDGTGPAETVSAGLALGEGRSVDYSGTFETVDEDGYTLEISVSGTMTSFSSDITNSPPGKTEAVSTVDMTGSAVNTTTGRNAPTPALSVVLLYPKGSIACNMNGVSKSGDDWQDTSFCAVRVGTFLEAEVAADSALDMGSFKDYPMTLSNVPDTDEALAGLNSPLAIYARFGGEGISASSNMSSTTGCESTGYTHAAWYVALDPGPDPVCS